MGSAVDPGFPAGGRCGPGGVWEALSGTATSLRGRYGRLVVEASNPFDVAIVQDDGSVVDSWSNVGLRFGVGGAVAVTMSDLELVFIGATTLPIWLTVEDGNLRVPLDDGGALVALPRQLSDSVDPEF